jgi:hypothetical protein
VERRCTEVTLKEHIDSAARTASALLAENYLAQDRNRLIHCLKFLDEATRAIEGGMWIGKEKIEAAITVVKADADVPAAPARRGGLLVARSEEPVKAANEPPVPESGGETAPAAVIGDEKQPTAKAA